MNEQLRLSLAGQRLVQAFESCLKPVGGGNYRAYVCPAGVLTIGWGHTNDHGRHFDSDTVWTRAQCDEAFREDMGTFERAVRRLVQVPLRQYQFDALVSFAFNCGEGALSKSTLLRKVNAGDFGGAAGEFGKWVRGGGKVLPGLVRRRASEALLFQNIPDADYDGRPDGPARPQVEEEPAASAPLPMPQRVDLPDDQPKPASESKSIWAKVMEFVTGGGLTIGSVFAGLDWRVAMLIIGVLAVFTLFILYERLKRPDIQRGQLLGSLFGDR